MTKRNNYIELRELFLKYLEDNNIVIFKYTILRQWYLDYRLKYDDNFGYGYSANIHRLIIRELQRQGRVVNIKRNTWQVVKNPKVFDTHKEVFKIKDKDEDEFDKHLKRKLSNELNYKRKEQ